MSANAALFAPFTLGRLTLANRIVMAPMTRSYSPEGIPGADVAAYYRRRAEEGVGLIVTEGTYLPHPAAGFDAKVPHLYGERALAGWRHVVDEVHAAGGKIFSQLWHVGTQGDHPGAVGASASLAQIETIIHAFGAAAANAKGCGFDGVEIHGAHGYLVDQFFWEGTNHRTDAYGGDARSRTRFAVEVATGALVRISPSLCGIRNGRSRITTRSSPGRPPSSRPFCSRLPQRASICSIAPRGAFGSRSSQAAHSISPGGRRN